jgi:hypothetical protein
MKITVFWGHSSHSSKMFVALYQSMKPHILGDSNVLDIPSRTYLAKVLHGFLQPLHADAAKVSLNKPPF